MLFRLRFLLYCIFVSNNQFLFFSCILYYVACAFVICLIKYLLTYLLIWTLYSLPATERLNEENSLFVDSLVCRILND